jgi:glycosyltransferase involved in cell wall biosynthesis
MHFGTVPSRDEYAKFLHRGDIVVSTAGHEFFGMAVLEAVRAGCRPLLPNRLSYPENFPVEFLYEEEEFQKKLIQSMERGRLTKGRSRELTQRFSWNTLADQYTTILTAP